MQKLKKTGDRLFALTPSILKAVCFISFLLLWGNVFAQKFTASVNKTRVAADETFQLQFSIDGSGSGFQAPPLNDFDVVSGPNASQSMQIINGNMSQSVSYSFFLHPKKEGRFTIGPATINAGGKKMESNSLVVEVVKGSGNGRSNPTQAQGARSAGDNLFVRTVVNKSKVFQGECITITHKVYTRINLVGFQNAKLPSYTGFWSQDIANQTNYTITKENLNGITYSVVEFKKSFLFPQRSGSLDIDPIEIDCVVRQQSRNQDPWSFFGMGTEDVPYKIKGQTTHIEVIPLPDQGKPEGYSGAVGQFTLKAQMNKDKVKTNEAVNLNVSVSGKGNINLVDPPKFNIPPDIESYDPKFSENISVKAGGVEGTKSGEYVLIPRQRGEYKIQGLTFSYFDPEKKTYISLHSPEFSLSVEKGSNDTSAASLTSPSHNRKEVAVIGKDIRYIKTSPFNLEKKGYAFFGSLSFFCFYLIPGFGFLLFVFLRRKYQEDNKDIQHVRSREAKRMAQKRLKIARTYIDQDNKEKFYEEITRTLYTFLSDRLFIPVSELSKMSISAALKARHAEPDTTEELIAVLNLCEYARYAPSGASGSLAEVYDRSIKIIMRLEEEITKAKKN